MPLSPPIPDAPYLTNREAAAFLRLAPRTLDRYRYLGCGPRYHKFGRKVIYARLDLEVWSNQRTYRTASEKAPEDLGSQGNTP